MARHFGFPERRISRIAVGMKPINRSDTGKTYPGPNIGRLWLVISAMFLALLGYVGAHWL